VVELVFKRPTAGYKLTQGQIELIKYYIDDRDFGHDCLPWIINADGSKELTEYHKHAMRLLREIDRSTERERNEAYQQDAKEQEENKRMQQIQKQRQSGFIPRTKAKPRMKFPEKSRVVGATKATQELARKYKGDYAKFRKEMMEKMKRDREKAASKKKSTTTH
jgi:hypothetical protein